MKIYTHDGTFHSDEVFATAILKKFIKGSFEIIRTRDEVIIGEAKRDKNSFVIDVGGEYNEKMKNFDHHQRTFKEYWPNRDKNKSDNSGKILYSSCGLVWKYLRKKGYLKSIEKNVLNAIEDNLIKKIDNHDNGGPKWPLCAMVSSCNREESNMDDFNKAVEIAEMFFDNILYQETQNNEKYNQFLSDIKLYDSDLKYFISKNTIKDVRVLNKISHDTNALFIIYPQYDEGIGESWMVKSVNRYVELENGNRSIQNLLAPESWRGLSGKGLSSVSGLKGLLFVHRTGFLIGVRTKSQAIKVAQHIINNYNIENKFK